MYRKSKRNQQTESSTLPCFKSKSKQQTEPSTLPMLHVDLLNDVIEPVTFACSVEPGGDVHIIHIYIYIYTYIYWRIAQHGTASGGLAQARPNYILAYMIMECVSTHSMSVKMLFTTGWQGGGTAI